MSIASKLTYYKSKAKDKKLVIVTKNQSLEDVLEVYKNGFRIFAENKVQNLIERQQTLPKDIEWHLIGHLQSNKVKQIAPFINCIQSVDSIKLATFIQNEALKNNRVIDCFLQIHVAQEATKFGFTPDEIQEIAVSKILLDFPNIRWKGIMAMATQTNNLELVKREFASIKQIYETIKVTFTPDFTEISMGMTNDFELALEEGATLIRIGSGVFEK